MEPEGHLTETEEIADDLVRMDDEEIGAEVEDSEGARDTKTEQVLEKSGQQTK
jgi:putative ABC transport system ATP-binding protein